MNTLLNLKDCPHTLEYLDVSQGEDCPMMMDLDALQGILPTVVMATENDDSLVKASVVISYTINSLRKMWDELMKGGKE